MNKVFWLTFVSVVTGYTLFIFIVLLVISIGFIASNTFETETILLKFSLSKEDSITKYISIFSENGGEIELFLKGIEKGVSIKEKGREEITLLKS